MPDGKWRFPDGLIVDEKDIPGDCAGEGTGLGIIILAVFCLVRLAINLMY